MRTIVLYNYYVDEQRMDQNFDLVLERNYINLGSRNEHELIYAVSNKLDRKARYGIASKPGVVYHDHDANIYRVWFDVPNRDKAIEAIGNYILDHVSSEIKSHKSFIERLEKEKKAAIKLLDKRLPTV